MTTKPKQASHLQNAFDEQFEAINQHILTLPEDIRKKIEYSCEQIGFDYRYVFLRNQSKEIIEVRFMIMQMLKDYGVKLHQTASVLRLKDHSTVISGLKKNKYYQVDEGYANRAFLVQFPTPQYISLGRK